MRQNAAPRDSHGGRLPCVDWCGPSLALLTTVRTVRQKDSGHLPLFFGRQDAFLILWSPRHVPKCCGCCFDDSNFNGHRCAFASSDDCSPGFTARKPKSTGNAKDRHYEHQHHLLSAEGEGPQDLGLARTLRDSVARWCE